MYNITKPGHIKCISSCKLQDDNTQVSFFPYPQQSNFFYEKKFCDVASHIWQRTCQDADRKHFLDKEQEKLCLILKNFDEYFGGMSPKKDNVRIMPNTYS